MVLCFSTVCIVVVSLGWSVMGGLFSCKLWR